MGKINMGRMLLGGVVAGLIYDVLDWFIDGLWLGPRWATSMAALGHGGAITARQVFWLEVIGILAGIAAVWVYSAIRPRYGAGMGTAIRAGVAVWVLGWVLPNAAMMWLTGLFPARLTFYTTVGGLVEMGLGTIVGAALYREARVAAVPASTEKPAQAARV